MMHSGVRSTTNDTSSRLLSWRAPTSLVALFDTQTKDAKRQIYTNKSEEEEYRTNTTME